MKNYSVTGFAKAPSTRATAALALVLALGFLFHADGAFLRWETHRDMLRQVSVIGILASGMTIVVITGGIDLAVGSVLALGAVIFSLLTMHWGWPAWQAIGATLLIGAASGALSGGLIARIRMQPFIATLAMMVFARGVAKWISGGEKISTTIALPDGTFQSSDAPAIFDAIGSRVAWESVAVVTLIFAASLAVCWILLARLKWGRYCYAVGGNEEAARLSGVPVKSVKVMAYAVCGLLAALAGICQAAQELQGDPEAGTGYELSAIAMVVIGGTSLRGGVGNIWLTAIGALTIGYLEKILSINAVGEETRLMLTGVIIVGAVMLQRRRAGA